MQISLTSPFAAEQLKAKTALLQVLDPELNINIIDLGLVYDLDFAIADRLTVIMTLSTPHCPMGEAIQHGVIAALSSCFPERTTEIKIVWDPIWNFDMISEAGRNSLGIG